MRGVAMWRDGRKREAVALLDAALRDKPEFPEALCMGGYILGESGKSGPALQFYRRAISLKLDFPAAWSNIGKLLFELGRARRGARRLRGALALSPATPTSGTAAPGRFAQTRSVGRIGRGGAAEALRLRPDFAEAALNLGNARLKLDQVAEALEAYRLASSLKPDFSAALCGQALALCAVGRLEEARAAFESSRTARQRRGGQRQGVPRPRRSAISNAAGKVTNRAGSTESRSTKRSACAFPSGAGLAERASGCW